MTSFPQHYLTNSFIIDIVLFNVYHRTITFLKGTFWENNINFTDLKLVDDSLFIKIRKSNKRYTTITTHVIVTTKSNYNERDLDFNDCGIETITCKLIN